MVLWRGTELKNKQKGLSDMILLKMLLDVGKSQNDEILKRSHKHIILIKFCVYYTLPIKVIICAQYTLLLVNLKLWQNYR